MVFGKRNPCCLAAIVVIACSALAGDRATVAQLIPPGPNQVQPKDLNPATVMPPGVSEAWPHAEASSRMTCPPGQASILIEVTTDSWGSETSWELAEQISGTIVASGGGYASNTYYSTEYCGDPSLCYVFTIHDSYGDGIFSPGGYIVSYEGLEVADTMGGLFGDSQDTVNVGGGCKACPPGPGWVGACIGGDDVMMTSARVGIDLPPLDCTAPPDTILTLTGPMVVRRSDPLGGGTFIWMEILSMSLTDGEVTLSAGQGGGTLGWLRSSIGEIAEQAGDNTQADSFFAVFFELDMGGPGPFYFNSEQEGDLRVTATIDCVPPEAVFLNTLASACTPLYMTPDTIGLPLANLLFVEHYVPVPPPPPPDYHASPAGISWVRFDPSGDVPGIPPDFFGPGSDPVEGQVDLEGDPIDPATLGGTSTILQRSADPVAPGDPVGAAGTVEIELVALSLRSTQPITVTYNGGMTPEDWNVHVDLVSPSPVSLPVGSLTATKTHPNGGTYDVTLTVQPLLTFTRVSDGLVMLLDTAAEGEGPYELQGSGHFVHAVDSFFDVYYDPAAQWVGGIEENIPGDTTSQIAEQISVEPPNFRRWLVHGIIPPPLPPPPPPPDYHASPAGISWVRFDPSGDVPGIPPDFFGPGSDPFEGQVDLEGDPIDPATLGGTSTILQRTADPVAPGDPAGTEGTVDIELVTLSLRSTQPITVTYNGGQDPEEWNVHVDLVSPSPVSLPVGSLTATKTHANGGTYDVTIHVQPLLTFTRISDGQIMPLDTAAEGEGPYELHASGNFVHAVDSLFYVYYDPAAQWVGGIEETIPGDTTSQIAEQISVEPPNFRRWLVHGVVPPPPPECQPNAEGTACIPDACSPIPEDRCLARCMNFDTATGATTITQCDCINGFDPVDCHVEAPPAAAGGPCIVDDDGSGTVTLPPVGCEYLSPNEVHEIIDGLPPGTTIELDASHRDFLNVSTSPGGSLGGEIDTFDSALLLNVSGTGLLTGFNRTLFVPVASEVHTAPRTPGDPVQSFANDMYRLQGELFGDPDFCTFRVTGGTDFGLPSPGQTTLTDLGDGTFHVDSFFDIAYQIDFEGCPGSQLDGFMGITTGTIRMRAGTDLPTCVGGCDAGFVCQQTVTGNADGTIDACCDCVLLPTVGDPDVAPYPHNRRKNRYISFDPNKVENDGNSVAFKVELKQLTLGSCDGNGGFCREDRKACSGSGTTCTIDLDCPLFPFETCSVWTDCNTCSVVGNPCIIQPIDCAPAPPQTCDPTGQQCVNDAPDVGGTSVGQVWWVGPECPSGTGSHLMVSQPFRKVSTNWPNPTHAGDCEIVPEAVYGVRAVNVTSGAESGEILIETTLYAPISASWWADCVGPLKKFCGGDIRTPECTGDADCTAPQTCDRAWTLPEGSVNFDDVNAALALVAPGATTVPPHMTWVDLHGNACNELGSQNFDPPNWVANFSDVGQIISGFGGFPYKGYDPADCPNTDVCCSP